MPSNSVHVVDSVDLDGLRERVGALSTRSVQLVTLRDRLQSELAAKQKEVKELSANIELLGQVCELFRVLMDVMVVKQVRVIEDLVTEGLQSIWHDRNLHFEADVAQRYGKVAIDFFIRQGDKDDPLSHRGRPLDSFGGGPSTVASLILRVLTVLRLKLWPVLILDEALGAVSSEYVDQTGQFLRKLAATLELDILLVTHKHGFLHHADRVFKCSDTVQKEGTRRLVLEQVG